jgi:hypothetical protein
MLFSCSLSLFDRYAAIEKDSRFVLLADYRPVKAA